MLLLGAASAVVSVAGMRAAAWLIGPAFLALVIVISVSPVQAWMRRRGVPRWISTVVLILVLYAVIVVLTLVVAVSVAQLATLLPRYAGPAEDLLRSLTTALSRLGISAEQVHAALKSVDFGKVLGFVGSLLSGVTSLSTNIGFLLVLLLFLGIEAGDADRRLAAIASDRPGSAGALTDFAKRTRSYLLMTTIFGLIVAVLDTVALALLGIPVPVLWGLLSFVTNYIPNIGFLIGLAPPALLALLAGGWRSFLVVILVYSLLNFVVQSLIQPRFVGHSVGLSTTTTLLALVFWAWVLGPIGALLAIPLTLLVKALLVDTDPRAGWAPALLCLPDTPHPSPVPPTTTPGAAPR
ncbi:Predicted PurR-regulated permease PerM [Allokutzneria albata]|uniref:Predicted PurR-regulated permease PerM n=1 Tax=Allokutzneria albata TaxID=211114 RepID=A0A1G9R5Z5_ALLAB|nr:Predicted PurR-regulated permease PerM [Allokutzneria albata]